MFGSGAAPRWTMVCRVQKHPKRRLEHWADFIGRRKGRPHSHLKKFHNFWYVEKIVNNSYTIVLYQFSLIAALGTIKKKHTQVFFLHKICTDFISKLNKLHKYNKRELQEFNK